MDWIGIFYMTTFLADKIAKDIDQIGGKYVWKNE